MDFTIKRGKQYAVYVDMGESEAVQIAAENLRADMGKVFGTTGRAAKTYAEADILIFTLGVKKELDLFWQDKELLEERGVMRKEGYLLQVREGKLLIAGTDRRGTVYGIYEFCERIGVSPWYFWADVPVKEKQEMTFGEDFRVWDYPSVEYRGIFINDEEELETWVQKHMGEPTIGVKTYEKIFELLLRLKANYIWPAMHVNSFNLKKENGALADRMGIVVGTSHCDMLMRSNNREWKPWLKKKGYENVSYDYSVPGRNREILKEYWRESIEQNREFEVCYTLGMRGIHDSGFETSGLKDMTTEERKQAEIELLSGIIRDQRKMLKEGLGTETMTTFIPYKEVLPLYDGGLEIPEDVTLVWANDNYGYIRRYPSEKEKQRKGGNGIYYHNSYWAPPSMSYVFLCSIPLAHTRNELQKAYNEGIRKLWVLNVGAIKPLEQEVEFFLRLAWEIGKETGITQDVDAYVEHWVNRNFQGNIGKETAKLLNDFSQLTNVRKLENMDTDAFSQTSYGDEAAVRIHRYEELFKRGNALYEKVQEKERDAFFQLVLFRIHAGYFTNLQYYYGDRSTLACNQGKMQAALEYTRCTRAFEDLRRRLIVYYNQRMAEGKWDGIVNPEGFPPPRAAMMPVCTPPLSIGASKLLVNIWNEEEVLVFRQPGVKWLEIGNGGEGELPYEIEYPEFVQLPDFQNVHKVRGTVRTEKRILVRVEEAAQKREGSIRVRSLAEDREWEIPVRIRPYEELSPGCFYEEDGMVCVPADRGESQDAEVKASAFHEIKRLGRGEGSLMETLPPGENSAPLSYRVCFAKGGEFLLEVHRFPSLNSVGRIRIGVAVDQGPMQLLETMSNDEWRGSWRQNVLNNVDLLTLRLPYLEAGEHKISFFAIDKYFAFSRFIIYTDERKENNFAGILGNQRLPEKWDEKKWADGFYGKVKLAPRPLEYARPDREQDDLGVTDFIKYEESYAETVEPDFYFREGESIFEEEKGALLIDAASALAQSNYAWTEGTGWSHCASESYGRSGLALYIRPSGLTWKRLQEAPSLHYRIRCSGGSYTVWLLAKFNRREEAFLSAGIDNQPLSEEHLYCKGCLWRYEAEQIYRYVPVAQAALEEGEHTLSLYGLASGMRFDRIYVTKGGELPPGDIQWTERKKHGNI